MFLDEVLMEKNVLRQGDIVLNTQIFGTINFNSISHHMTRDGRVTAWTVNTPPVIGPAIILSHSCEIDISNGIKVTSIILSPLRDVNTATKPEKVAELIKSNLITRELIENGDSRSYLKYFYLDPHPLLPMFDKGCIVDFSKCYSVRNQSYEILVKNKALQMKPDIADLMALKFSIYFHRYSKEA
jgi:hypothetical protein